MSKTVENIDASGGTLYLDDGTDLRVNVAAVSDAETHYGVNVRQWITRSNAERFGVVAGNGRTRSTYTGPDGRHGLSLLQPWQAYELAELIAKAAMEAEALERTANPADYEEVSA